MDAPACQILTNKCGGSGSTTEEISYCFLCCHGHEGTPSRSLDHRIISGHICLMFCPFLKKIKNKKNQPRGREAALI